MIKFTDSPKFDDWHVDDSFVEAYPNRQRPRCTDGARPGGFEERADCLFNQRRDSCESCRFFRTYSRIWKSNELETPEIGALDDISIVLGRGLLAHPADVPARHG